METTKQSELSKDDVIQVLLANRRRISVYGNVYLHDSHLADDVFQAVCLDCLKVHETLMNQKHVLNWAMKTMRFKAIDEARRRQRSPLVFSSETLEILEPEWINPERKESIPEQAKLKSCMEQLSKRNRMLLKMRYGEAMKPSIIATHLGGNVAAIYKALTRVRRFLRDCVANALPQEVTE